MKTLLLVLLICTHQLYAQEFAYPKLPVIGNSLQTFTPSDWFIKDSTTGDLNGDKLDDLAFVLEYEDTVHEVRPDGSNNTGSPRILVVLLKSSKTNKYHLFLQNNTFIVRYGEGGMDPEAYDHISIEKGILLIHLQFLRGHTSYKFRMQNKDLYLIGGTSFGASGNIIEGLDVNFNTRKAKIEEGEIDGADLKTRWVTLPPKPLRKLRDMKYIYEEEVVKGYYL